MHKIWPMRFFLKFKWIFLFIGFRLGGGRVALMGFLLGAFIDYLISPPTIRFRVYNSTGPQGWGSAAGSAGTHTYYNPQLDHAYSVLQIPRTASDDEVRQAYRRMALRYHPDRLASQGEEARLAAERALQQINQARDTIFKARGLK